MNRLLKFILGTTPESGTYYSDNCCQSELVLLNKDIGKKFVRLHFVGQAPALLTHRSFHEGYTQHKKVFI